MSIPVNELTAAKPLAPAIAPAQTQTGIISAEAYEKGMAQWLELLDEDEHTALATCFSGVDGQHVPYMSFPVQRIVELLSASPSGRIKAHFIVLPNASGDMRVTLALFALDEKNRRVSSYYVANEYATAVAAPLKMHTPKAKLGPSIENEVAGVLANHWRQNWAEATLTAEHFATPYGPLRGYTFKALSFFNLLFKLTSFDKQEVRLHFALRAYSHQIPGGGDAATATVGLLVQLTGTRARLDEDDTDYDSDYDGDDTPPFGDMAAPCPPSC